MNKNELIDYIYDYHESKAEAYEDIINRTVAKNPETEDEFHDYLAEETNIETYYDILLIKDSLEREIDNNYERERERFFTF